MNDKLNELAEEFSEKIENFERKLDSIRMEVADSERAAYARGLKEGLEAQKIDFNGKTFVVKVPEGKVDETIEDLRRAGRPLNCQFVIVADYVDLKDLHEIELKALGLKRLE